MAVGQAQTWSGLDRFSHLAEELPEMSWTLACPNSALANVSAAVMEELRSLLSLTGTNPERTIIRARLDSFCQPAAPTDTVVLYPPIGRASAARSTLPA
jgi:hypothetical protein